MYSKIWGRSVNTLISCSAPLRNWNSALPLLSAGTPHVRHSPHLQTPVLQVHGVCTFCLTASQAATADSCFYTWPVLCTHACLLAANLVTILGQHSPLALGAEPRHSPSSRHASTECLFCLCMSTTVPTEASCTAMAFVASMHGVIEDQKLCRCTQPPAGRTRHGAHHESTAAI